MMDFSADQFAHKELPYFGKNFAGQPLGDYEGYREIVADENLDGEHDPLVEIKNELLVRPMYFEQGLTDDSRLFLREPALKHFMEYDRLLRENFGWQIRIVDGFRPWRVQQKGFCWGVGEVVKNRGKMTMHEFLKMLKDAVEGRTKDVALLEKYLQEADVFFAYVSKVAEKTLVSAYLKSCGVDLERFYREDAYFDEIWLQIKQNRRVAVHLADSINLLFFGLESWHANANDERGGVRFKRFRVVSGSGKYAVQMGQKESACGSAGKLWEKLTKH